jgi:hypothetical protein
MFQSLTLQNLGPITELTVAIPVECQNPGGSWLEFAGHSEVCKTFIQLGVRFLLNNEDINGKPVELDAIRDGAKFMEAQGLTTRGRIWRRRMTAGRSMTGYITKQDGSETKYTSGEKFLAGMGPIGSEVDLARLVMMPLSWTPLSIGTHANGRPLRDMLCRILDTEPIEDVVAALMKERDFEMREGDSTDEKGAYAQRGDANTTKSKRAGELTAAKQVHREQEEAAQRGAGPSAEDAAAAEATLTLLGEWGTYETLGAAVGRHQASAEQHAGWVKRKDALGERPDDNSAAIAEADVGLSQANGALTLAQSAVSAARNDLAAAERALLSASTSASRDSLWLAAKAKDNNAANAFTAARNKHNALPEDDSCDKCNRAGWDKAAEHRAETEAQRNAAEQAMAATSSALIDETEAANARQSAAVTAARATIETAKTDLATAEARADEAQPGVTEANRLRDIAVASGTAAREWDSNVRVLGIPPHVEPAPTGNVEAPAEPKPNASEVAAARSVRAQVQRAAGAKTARTEDVAVGVARVERAREEVETATAEAVRCSALLECVRLAPSVASKRAIETFSAGPVTLRQVDDGVQVLIDGRRWERASFGRLLYADIYLRGAWRSSLKLTVGTHKVSADILPLFVDNAQAWSGDWPMDDVPGPVYLMRTTPGPLTVKAMVASGKE